MKGQWGGKVHEGLDTIRHKFIHKIYFPQSNGDLTLWKILILYA